MRRHDAVERSLGLDADAMADVDADMMDVRLFPLEKNRRAGEDGLAVLPATVDQAALVSAALSVLVAGMMDDVLTQLPQRPAEQAGAVGDVLSDPARAVFDGHGPGGGFLPGGCPDDAGAAVDVPPALMERDVDLIYKLFGRDDEITPLGELKFPIK